MEFKLFLQVFFVKAVRSLIPSSCDVFFFVKEEKKKKKKAHRPFILEWAEIPLKGDKKRIKVRTYFAETSKFDRMDF